MKMATGIFIPKMGANIDRAQIGKIHVKEGDDVKKGDTLMEMVTDKATFDIEADASGKILKLACKEKDEVDVLEVVGYIGQPGEAIPEIKKKEKTAAVQEEETRSATPGNAAGLQADTGKVKATPGARKLAKEKRIDIDAEFAGSTRVIKEDDLLRLASESELKEQSFRKKAEVAHLTKSRENIYSSVTAQISASKAKKKMQDTANEKKIRLSLGEYISYNAAITLREFPNLNAHYTPAGVRTYKNVNLGVAMSPGEDLMVPVIKISDKLSLAEFSEKYSELLMKTIRNTIEPGDIENGTFTVTDLSAYGTFDFMPVINEGQSAILGISAEHDSCTETAGKLVYDAKMNLTLAFDHRVIDGKYALMFLQKLKSRIE